MTPTWTYNAADALWELRIDGELIYHIGSNRKPTKRETRDILTRLTRYYPWLRHNEQAAA